MEILRLVKICCLKKNQNAPRPSELLSEIVHLPSPDFSHLGRERMGVKADGGKGGQGRDPAPRVPRRGDTRYEHT